MKSKPHPIVRSSIACLVLVAAGCGQSSGGPNTVDVVTWWSATGESNALGALRTLFATNYPKETWNDDTILGGSTVARAAIADKMLAGQPPETFQANGGWDLLGWVLYNNVDASDSKMDPIDDVAKAWKDAIPGPVLDTVSFGGHIYAVPLDIHRVNTLFFNKKLFADNNIPVPTSTWTLDDLFSTAAAFQTKGITPIALGTSDPWTLGILLFENLLVARAGGAYYRTFFLGQGNALAPEIAAAVDDLSRLLSYTNANAQQLAWNDAVDMVQNQQAAMTIMGDWTKGYLDGNGATADVSYGEVAMPGTDGTFIFTTDTFGWPTGAHNREGLTDLLTLFGSEEGQDAFNPIKGSISARGNPNTLAYDPLGRKTIADFLDADQDVTTLVPATAILAPQEFMTVINAALGQFAGEGPMKGNASVVLHTLDNWSDVLRKSPWH